MRTLLVLVALVGLSTVVATILVGSGRYEPTVVHEPYETGLRWDADRKDRERSGWQVTLLQKRVTTGMQDLDLKVNGRSGRSLDGAAVEITFLRPFTTVTGRSFPAVRHSLGQYRVPVDIPERGRWDLQIAVTQGGQRILFGETIYAD